MKKTYSVIYRVNIDQHVMGIPQGQHGVREYHAFDSVDALSMFKDSPMHSLDTPIAVVAQTVYEVSLVGVN